MPKLSMLTILIQAASAVKNTDSDPSLQGYVEDQGLTTCKVIMPNEVEVNFVVLDSIGDILLQNNQVLAISPNIQTAEESSITILVNDLKADSDLELLAEPPIRWASKVVSSINVTVVPNPEDHKDVIHGGGQLATGGPLGNIREVINGKSIWDEVKKDLLFCTMG